ncbi:YtpI family protein [Bacillus marasmi]|uniref:YtpI family protein n=1 Tax=Bacillus marasmi TaxID=1926279 RepID=UPI0011C77FFB|nr:YtpI family protein [Bacillus marasmi]
MPIIVFFIMICLAFYLYYKTKYFRSNRPAEKQWLGAKSSIMLGLFVGLFGINQLFLFDTTVTYIVAAIFIVLGFLSAFNGFKAYRFYLPYVEKEAKDLLEN